MTNKLGDFVVMPGRDVIEGAVSMLEGDFLLDLATPRPPGAAVFCFLDVLFWLSGSLVRSALLIHI